MRISLSPAAGLDYVDPALSFTQPGWALLDATCARLMTYPDKAPPEGFRLVPEVAAGYPRVSDNGKTYTFTIRRGFRFSNGEPVRASAFARAITRTLKLNEGDALQLVQDIVGANRVREGKAEAAEGITARGNRLVIRLTRPAPAFPARMTAPWFCAVPPSLPVDPEGLTTFPAAGPYYVAENVRGRRIVLRRNRFYRGSRPHRVDRFVVEGEVPSLDEMFDRIERGTADWGHALAFLHLQRGLHERYGVNGPRFFLRPGLVFRHYHLNTSRPLFRNNPRLRRAVNFAIDRAAVRAALGSPFSLRLSDQYLPPGLPGFRDDRIYPLGRADVRKARTLAHGVRRGGKAVLYAPDIPFHIAAAQVIKRNLARIGLEVEIKGIPITAYYPRLSNPREPWDIAFADWAPDHLDPYAYLNLTLDGRFVRANNLSHFDSATYNRQLRRTARLRGEARYRAYGALDVRLARDAAPMVAIGFLNQATFVSRRVDPRCIVLRPALDLTAVCLKR